MFICGNRFVWKKLLPRSGGGGYGHERVDGVVVIGREGDELIEGAVELAVEGGFVAVDEVEDAGLIGESAEGAGGADGGGTVGVVEGHFLVDDGLFDTPGAHLAPVGGGEFLDEGAGGGGGGLMFEGELMEEFIEEGLGLVVEDDGLGEEAVAEAIAGGGLAAFGCSGSA